MKLCVRLKARSDELKHAHSSAYVSIRQHMSAYVSICQHMSAYVSIRQHTGVSVHEAASDSSLSQPHFIQKSLHN